MKTTFNLKTIDGILAGGGTSSTLLVSYQGQLEAPYPKLGSVVLTSVEDDQKITALPAGATR